jgi:hypothetical protein
MRLKAGKMITSAKTVSNFLSLDNEKKVRKSAWQAFKNISMLISRKTAAKDLRIKYLYPKLEIAAVPRLRIKKLRNTKNDISLRTGILWRKDKGFMIDDYEKYKENDRNKDNGKKVNISTTYSADKLSLNL